MPVPRNLLSTGLALTSLGASIGFRNKQSDFLDNPQDSTRGQKIVETGIRAVTTAATLAGTFYAAARYKNPYLTSFGMALSAGGAYATGRIYKQQQVQKMSDTGTGPGLGEKLLEGGIQLGALYYGAKALSPYVARSVSRMDSQFRPWAKSMGDTIEQARLGNIGEYSNIFSENLDKARKAYSTADSRFPLQEHLNIIYNIRSQISNVELAHNAEQSVIGDLMKKYSVTDRSVTNGMRQATLSDAVKHGQAFNYQPLLQHKMDLNELRLGKGVYFDTKANKIINIHKYLPENILTGAIGMAARNFKIPVLNFNPIAVLRPNEIIQAMRNRHAFHVFPEGTPIGPMTKAGKRGAAFIGGNLFDISSGKKMTSGLLLKTGRFVEETIAGKTDKVFRETAAGRVLRMRYGVGMGTAGEGEINLGNKIVQAPKTRFHKFMANTLEMDLPFIYSSGKAEYASTWDKIWAVVRGRQGGKSAMHAISDAMKLIFDPESFSPTTSKLSAFPTVKTKFGEVGYGFLPTSDIPGTAAFWQAERPVRLLESLGIGGFDPRTTRSAADVMAKMMFKRALPMYIAWKMLQATNDLGHATIGYGPMDVPADLVAGTNVATAYMRQALGIDKLAQYFENLMPGSVSSSGPGILRGFGIPLLAGAKYGPKGLAAGAAVSALLGGSSGQILKTPQEVKDEYFGQGRVPIRGGRWWEMGAGPFEGGKVKYYVPNWYRRLKSRYQYTDVQYGSEGEYWKNIADPYHNAIKHYRDRPYPLATSGMEEFPFIGPLLGGLFAPPMMMHQDELYGRGGGIGVGPGVAGPGSGPGGIAGVVAASIGTGGAMLPQQYEGQMIKGTPQQKAPYGVAGYLGGNVGQEAISPFSLKNRIGESIYQANEYAGMYGFLANTIKNRLTGNQDYFTQPQLESAERIGSAERAYWEKDFGGLFESTELFRRFLPHRRHDIEYLNPLKNTMPEFMPGSDYFTNFQIGDPYAKVPYGEFRLPGAGYEKFHKPGEGIVNAASQLGASNLISSDPAYANYSPMDMYRILSDVAPYSWQARYAQQYTQSMAKAGLLTPEADAERKRIRKETSTRKKNYKFANRRFTEGGLQDESVLVGSYLGGGKFTVKGHANEIYRLAGVKGITDEGEDYLSSIIKPGERLTVQTLADKRYRKKMGTTIPTVPVLVGPLNRHLITGNMAQFKKTGPGDVYAPLNTAVEFSTGERIVGGAWERFSHLNTPLHNKFLHQKTALEEYRNQMLYDSGQADWQHPVRDFILPYLYRAHASGAVSATLGGSLLGFFGTNKKARVTLAAVGALTGLGLSITGNKNFVPEYRKRERDVDQYFDILKYLKNKKLYEVSRERAIEEEGIDPEELIRSVEASKEARGAISKALERKYGEASLDRLYDKEGARGEKGDLAAAMKFLSYQKFTEDEVMHQAQTGFTGAALEFRKRYQSTMYGADVHGDFASIMRALPTKEREFFNSFVNAPADKREEIKGVTPLGMRRFLEAKWGEHVEDNPDLTDYFKTHKLPNDSWIGYHPAVNLDDVKLKVVQNEGFEKHDFNMWDAQAAQLAKKPYVPLIDPFSTRGNHQNIKRELEDILTGQGYNNYDVAIQDYSGSPDTSVSIDVKYATDKDAKDYIKSNMGRLMSPAYIG